MDGVCDDWVSPALLAHRSALTRDEITGWVNEQLGLSMEELWVPIDAQGAEWWENLEPLPWFAKLWEELQHVSTEVVICSSPSLSPYAVPGKIRWLHKHIGPRFRDYVFTSKKYLLAKPGNILIDDLMHNVGPFRAEGGSAILFPAPWNDAAPPEGKDIVDWIIEQVIELT